MQFIDLKAQYHALKDPIDSRLNHILNHGKYIMGPEVDELEHQLCDYLDVKHCVTVSSGTDALLISLLAIGIKPGDEVITTPFTFVATIEVIVLLGAVPVFVDVEPSSGNIDSRLIAEKLTEKTRAIIPVSLYGQPVDINAINSIALTNDLYVIEDGAQSFGSMIGGSHCATFPHIWCTSFFPSKPLGCYGDGGAIFTNDSRIAARLRMIRVHGQKARYVHELVGVAGRMDSLQCGIVLEKLKVFDAEIAKRLLLAECYNQCLDEIGIPRIQVRDGDRCIYAQYTIFVESRDDLIRHLTADGIPTAVHYPIPINQQKAYQKYCCPDCTPVAANLSSQVLSLPFSPYLNESDMLSIMTSIRYFFDDGNRKYHERV